MKNPFKIIGAILISICLTLGLSLSLQSLLAAWNPPTQSPPAANTAGPIYVSSSTDQLITQNGLNITLGNFSARVVGGTQLAGGVSIPATAPAPFTVNTSGSIITSGIVADGNTLYVASTTDRVGIGTAGPNKILHLYRTSENAELDIQSVAGAGNHWGIYHDSATDDLRFWKEGGNRFSITDDGNISIGEDVPDAGLKLDIEGRVGASEYCDQNGGNCKAITAMGGGGSTLYQCPIVTAPVGCNAGCVGQLTTNATCKNYYGQSHYGPDCEVQYGASPVSNCVAVGGGSNLIKGISVYRCPYLEPAVTSNNCVGQLSFQNYCRYDTPGCAYCGSATCDYVGNLVAP